MTSAIHRARAANARLLYGGVKLAHQADGPPRNAVMLLPPLIIERVERSFKRTVLAVTFNIGVRNHMWSHMIVPNVVPRPPALRLATCYNRTSARFKTELNTM